jgi:magnesium-transporting ATPase (P-type)
MGTTVREGSGRAVVVATGGHTAFGAIALGLGEHQPETAFQIGLRRFSALLAKVAAGYVDAALNRTLVPAVVGGWDVYVEG